MGRRERELPMCYRIESIRSVERERRWSPGYLLRARYRALTLHGIAATLMTPPEGACRSLALLDQRGPEVLHVFDATHADVDGVEQAGLRLDRRGVDLTGEAAGAARDVDLLADGEDFLRGGHDEVGSFLLKWSGVGQFGLGEESFPHDADVVTVLDPVPDAASVDRGSFDVAGEALQMNAYDDIADGELESLFHFVSPLDVAPVGNA